MPGEPAPPGREFPGGAGGLDRVHFTFRRMAEADLPLLHGWLEQPHVREFWSDEPRTLVGVAAHYRGVLDGSDPTHAFLAYAEDVPLGYLQMYRIGDYPDYAAHVDVGADAAGVDMLIGEPAYAQRGLGGPLLAQFVADIVWPVTGARACWIGPSVDNARAIRAYVKAGFEYVKTVHVPGEGEPEYLMRLVRAAG